MSRPVWLLPVVGVGAALLVGGLVNPPARPAVPPLVTRPVAGATLSCPGTPAGGGLQAVRVSALAVPAPGARPVPGTLTVAAAGGPARPFPADPLRYALRASTGRAAPLVLTATGAVASGLSAQQLTLVPGGADRGLADVGCVRPGVSWWFVGGSGALGSHDQLLLTNPGDGTAVADVSLAGPAGPLDVPSVQGLSVPAGGALALALDRVAPDVRVLAVQVSVRTGRLAAAIYDRRDAVGTPAGADWLPPTTAGTRLVVPGVFGGSPVYLVLATPGGADATVTVHLVTGTSSFVPTGLSGLVVPAGTTRAVALTGPLQGQDAALVVDSDQPVLAAASMVLAGAPDAERAWSAAVPALSGPTPVSDNWRGAYRDRLFLTAPAGAVTVRLQPSGAPGRTVTVAAGTTRVLSLGALFPGLGSAALVVVPLGPGPVYAAREVLGADANGPLVTVLTLVSPARTVSAPPVAPAAGFAPGG